MPRYIARAPGVTLAGRDYRPGDTFEAAAKEMQAHLDAGVVEPTTIGAANTPPEKPKADPVQSAGSAGGAKADPVQSAGSAGGDQPVAAGKALPRKGAGGKAKKQ
ncbi:MAG: hypothetical protein IT518_14715 [Burkholderiales bacterium]|nr:hypothetical protein [Burkholderiales bacterium]